MNPEGKEFDHDQSEVLALIMAERSKWAHDKKRYGEKKTANFYLKKRRTKNQEFRGGLFDGSFTVDKIPYALLFKIKKKKPSKNKMMKSVCLESFRFCLVISEV